MTCLVIDDEVQIRRLLRLALETRGHVVKEAASGQAGLQEAVFHKPDAILLDMGLPDMEGAQVLARLREWSDVPVLILTVRDEEALKVAVLEAGADDYITKPFSTAELMARLAAIARRRRQAETDEVSTGPLTVNLVNHNVTLEGQEVRLTATEYALLKALVRHPGRIVTQPQLIKEVWGPSSVDQSASLRVHVNHLRKKLRCETSGISIQNEPGIGYRLVRLEE